jgi:hypothetical protein
LENVQNSHSWLRKARQAVLSSLSLPDRSVTTSEKETTKALLHKFFPDELTAQESKQQENIRAQILELGPPDSHTEPIFTTHEVDGVIKSRDDKKCRGPDGMDGVIVNDPKSD